MAGAITLVDKTVKAVVKTVSFGIELYRCPKLSRNLHQMNPLGNMFFYDTRTKKCPDLDVLKKIQDYLSLDIHEGKKVAEFLEYFFNIYLKSTGNNKYISGQLFGFDSKKAAIKANTYFKHFFYHYVIYFADSNGNVYFYSVTKKQFISINQTSTTPKSYKELFDETDEKGNIGKGYMTLKKNVLTEQNDLLEDLRKKLMSKEYEGTERKEQFKTKNNVRRSLMIMNFEKLCQILHFYFHGSSSMIYYKLSRPELFDFSLLGNHYFFNTHRYFYTKLGPFRSLNKDIRDELKKTFSEKYRFTEQLDSQEYLPQDISFTQPLPILRTSGNTGSLDDSLNLRFFTNPIKDENLIGEEDPNLNKNEDLKDLKEQYGKQSSEEVEREDESIKPVSDLLQELESQQYSNIIQETPIYHLINRAEDNNIQDTMDARRRLLDDIHTNNLEYMLKEHYLDMYMATTNDEGYTIPNLGSSLIGGAAVKDQYQKYRKEKLDKCFQKKFEIDIEDLEIAFGRNMYGKNIGLFNKEGTKYPQKKYLEILKKIAEFLDYKSTDITTLKIVPFLDSSNTYPNINRYINRVVEKNYIPTNTYTVSSWYNIDLNVRDAFTAIIGAHMAIIGNKCNLGHLSRMRVTIGGIKYSGRGGGKKIITKKNKNISNHKTKKNKNQIKNIKKINKNKISRKKNIQKEKQVRKLNTKKRY